MKYLLDTCTVSDFVKGKPKVLTRVKATPPALIAISTLTRMEVAFGLHLKPARARELTPVLEAFFASITTLPFALGDAQAAASVRADLKARGRPIGPYDVLIGATALARGLTMVTSNTDEFERIRGLRLEDWR
ncbi:VapC toxin family PIN domain ribonuclease [Lamprobacter modestohalophilus]|uniref:Ribonuclease VapC n=1 Tax=Lamprobacter modestohalophilus TaxID=1064514 RepID=A0A9X0WCL9_9GAMM|nr:type II toxin-antitoxin system VapC family toxin [Lamprobacter modestohalophilus]MBK1621053.1 VapC toxin family PIN domain ribonuclease [Lamprobacter modestohalophilus]